MTSSPSFKFFADQTAVLGAAAVMLENEASVRALLRAANALRVNRE
jgi:hydroxyethylthiazole kinase-like sugar kinase family protein